MSTPTGGPQDSQSGQPQWGQQGGQVPPPQWGQQVPPQQGWHQPSQQWGQQALTSQPYGGVGGSFPPPQSNGGGLGALLRTPKGKLIAIGAAVLVVVLILAAVLFAVSGDDSKAQSFDLGDGVNVTLEVPSGWNAEIITNKKDKRYLVMQPHASKRSASEVQQATLEDESAPDFDITTVILRSRVCSKNNSDSLEREGYTRKGAWMVNSATKKLGSNYRASAVSAFRTAESCSGDTVQIWSTDGSTSGQPGSAGADLANQMIAGKVLTAVQTR